MAAQGDRVDLLLIADGGNRGKAVLALQHSNQRHRHHSADSKTPVCFALAHTDAAPVFGMYDIPKRKAVIRRPLHDRVNLISVEMAKTSRENDSQLK